MIRRKNMALCILVATVNLHSYAQGNVGINSDATRARFEVNGAGLGGYTSAVFGTEGVGVSFQKDWPTVGFNQYRRSSTNLGTRIGNGYAAIQYLNPATGVWGLDMHPTNSTAGSDITTAFNRAITIFPSASVTFGDENDNAVLNVNNSANTTEEGIYFLGTSYHSYINITGERITNISPGKAGGFTIINDIPGGHVSIGTASSKVGINTDPIYLTAWAIRNSTAGNGLVIINENNFNNWEWYASNDSPIWIGIKYNGNLIADFSPIDGSHHYVSDHRLKTAIRPLSPTLDRVLQLNPVRYTMKHDQDRNLVSGFIAQEVERIFPNLVSVLHDDTPECKGIRDLRMLNYNQFFVLAIKAIQEQQEQIRLLNEELIQLEKN